MKNVPKVYLKQTDGSRKIIEYCDLLFFHSHTFIGKGIQICTDSQYNHVALYIGRGNVLHAIGKGLLIQNLKEAWEDSDKYIDVYRYHGNDRIGLTFKQTDKLIEVANKYYSQNERYAVETLLMLAIITELRHDTGFLGRKMIDEAFNQLNSIIEGSKEPVICSEIDYRIFDEAGLPIRILPEGLYKEFRDSESPIIKEFIAFKENINKVVADFVTPKDLVMSPDINFIGQLQKEDI